MNEFERLHKAHEASRASKLDRQFGRFLPLLPVLTEDTQQRLRELPAPATVCGRECLQSLQRVTYGKLCRLQAAQRADYVETVTALLNELCGVQRDEVIKAPAREVLGAVAMLQREMERISKLFESVKPEPTGEEIQAGVESLSFGPFGVVDWYARRMGITDHEQAYDTPWARIYQCLKIDKEQADYERRLRTIYDNKNKRSK